ncbi:solute carrier family 52, riboflavin transporter, member 3-B [Wyeomyia smithii]|uniref:solute carrier family 52, riboflavin transporter, member 3-B n=1 Tax=Wyeomyia smithii TaxID=174621 RepID=UPI002467EDE9|nr:solute carrier family 52, riboflavin transporter, member 3-B [Wyeomyia smithii]XP_055523971.1 solute carrier family 52, riboflavin transporter, member 3-B [Wyeomyia smithii]XP_055523972.1 solute carrier family 52, riboflavin transporter, member 3-B [Wyeomyia smithii]
MARSRPSNAVSAAAAGGGRPAGVGSGGVSGYDQIPSSAEVASVDPRYPRDAGGPTSSSSAAAKAAVDSDAFVTSPSSSALTESYYLLQKSTAMTHKARAGGLRETFRNRSVLVDLLAILFGISAWIGVNSSFVQLPLLVSSAPEGWNLPSYMVIMTQIGNIGALLYTAVQKWKVARDSYIIYGLLVIGSVGSICMAFLYQSTAYLFGAERSVAMLACVFALALVGCTSSVLFMPYMGRFRDVYLITYLIGEGLSGFVPSIVALIQGVGGNAECIPNNSSDPNAPEFISYTPPPRFGSMEYFIFVFAVFIVSTVAFTVLDNHKRCHQEYAAVVISHGNDYTYEHGQQSAETPTPTDKPNVKLEKTKILSNRNYAYLMILLGILCTFGNGIFPSVQSYSCLPYGNVAYHLTVTLSTMANPVACFMALFLPHTSIRAIISISLLAAVFTVYALATAFMSPSPPLVGLPSGEVLVILTWTILIGLVSYVRLSITTVFRYQGGRSLVWVGAVTQIGSLLGSILSFTLVNFTDLFQQYYPC